MMTELMIDVELTVRSKQSWSVMKPRELDRKAFAGLVSGLAPWPNLAAVAFLGSQGGARVTALPGSSFTMMGLSARIRTRRFQHWACLLGVFGERDCAV